MRSTTRHRSRTRSTRTRRASTTAAAAAAVLLVACDDTTEPSAEDPPAVTGDDGADDEADDVAADDGPSIEVVDAGAEPREPLRLAYDQGTTVTGTITTETDLISAERDGEPTGEDEIPALPFEIDLEVEVVRADEDGAELRTRSTGARLGEDGEDGELDEGDREQLEATLQLATDVELTYEVDDRGRASEIELDLGVPGLEGFGDQLTDLAAPLPEEPVGVGAVWTVTETVQIGLGPAITQVATYELLDHDGDVVDLEVTIEGEAASGAPLEVPGEATFDVEVVRADVTGAGTLTMDLASPLPLAATSRVEVDQELEIDDGEAVQRQAQTVEVTTSFESG